MEETVSIVIGNNNDHVNAQIQAILDTVQFDRVVVLQNEPVKFEDNERFVIVHLNVEGNLEDKRLIGGGVLRMYPNTLIINDLPALIKQGLSEHDKDSLVHNVYQTGHNLIVGIPQDADKEAYEESIRVITNLLSPEIHS